MRHSSYVRYARLSAALAISLPALFAADAPPPASASTSATTETVTAPATPAQPLSLDDALKAFGTIPATPHDASSDSANSTLRTWNRAQSQLSNLNGYIENSDFTNALNQARQYANSANTPAIRKLWSDLISALQTETQTRQAAFKDKVAEICDRAGKLALTATKSAQLDGVLDELYAIQDGRDGNYSSRTQSTYSRVANEINFLCAWQDYLGQLEAGDIDGAINSLRNLNSSGYHTRAVSRSDVIKLIARLKPAPTSETTDLLAGATLDNLPAIRDRVIAARNLSNQGSNDTYALTNELDSLNHAVEELKLGRPDAPRTLLGTSNSTAPGYQSIILKLKDDYIIRALPVLSGLPKLDPAKPGETAIAYIDRLVDDAVKTEDWPRAQRLATISQDIMPDRSSCSVREPLVGANPATAIKAWMHAQLMDQAAQPYFAADYYRQALAAGAPPKLEEQIVARLRALAAEFPDSARLPR